MAKTTADFAVMREFGEVVHAARDARKWTQEQLAEHAGVDRTTVGSIEQGVGNPTLLTISKIAQALERNCADFFPVKP